MHLDFFYGTDIICPKGLTGLDPFFFFGKAMYSSRPPPPMNTSNSNLSKNSRLSEMLDAVKQQVDVVSQEAVHYKLQRDELEHKCILHFHNDTIHVSTLYSIFANE